MTKLKTVQHHPKSERNKPIVEITRHIAIIFEEGRLVEESNVHFLHIANLNQFKQHYGSSMLKQNIQANYMFGMRRNKWQ